MRPMIFMGLCFAVAQPACGDSAPATAPDATDAPDATGAADAPGAGPAPLAAFSDASKAFYHLVPDGNVFDGRLRVYYWPKMMWLAPFGRNPRLSVAKLANGGYVIGGRFARVDSAERARLEREASTAGLALISADTGLAHAICGSSMILDTTLASECGKPPRIALFGEVAFSANATAAHGTELEAKMSTHTGDGTPWDDVLAGEIAWTTPEGGVLRTKLEIACVGGFAGADALLFDSPDCKARYP